MDFTQHETTSPQDFIRTSVTILAAKIAVTISARGHCVLGLSGGSTPRPVYEALEKERGIDWSAVTIFLVDERCVPADHHESNQRMIREIFPRRTIIAPDTALPAAACADEYDQHLRTLFLTKGFPDIVTLGLGEDGHTASLFPPVPDEAFGERFAIHTRTKQYVSPDRITITIPVLTRATTTILLLSGEPKRIVWEEMIAAIDDTHRWPMKAILRSPGCEVVTRW